ncbi:MAG: hypothetical protein AAF456_19080 [Planctomycetota bacterium]
MFERIKRWLTGNKPPGPLASNKSTDETTSTDDGFQWYEVGDENPFPVRILDVRSLTWNVVATTQDQTIAATFASQRSSDGREAIDALIPNVESLDCELTFPHNGQELEGIVFKADSMEVKWDIYIYDSVFLFVRSWTGQLQYRAYAEMGDSEIRIYRIEAPSDLIDIAPQTVYFLLGSHAMDRVLPHTIPAETPEDPQTIGLMSFSMYGRLGCYATYEDITQIEIPTPPTAK